LGHLSVCCVHGRGEGAHTVCLMPPTPSLPPQAHGMQRRSHQAWPGVPKALQGCGQARCEHADARVPAAVQLVRLAVGACPSVAPGKPGITQTDNNKIHVNPTWEKPHGWADTCERLSCLPPCSGGGLQQQPGSTPEDLEPRARHPSYPIQIWASIFLGVFSAVYQLLWGNEPQILLDTWLNIAFSLSCIAAPITWCVVSL